MDIGTCLREAREGRSITLRQLADSTKLSTRVLQFIERNEFKRLPGGIFTKAYLRAYAVEVGVDPEGVVGEYLAQFPAPIVAERPSGPSLALGNSHAGRYVLAAVAVAVAVVALAAYGFLRDVALSSPQPALVEVPAPVETLVTDSAQSRELPSAARQEWSLYLDIQPTDACWVSVVADGQLIIARLLQNGERATAVARAELELRVGDPSVFAYTLNGVPGRPLGEAGKPVTVKITEGNYRTFLTGSAPEVRR